MSSIAKTVAAKQSAVEAQLEADAALSKGQEICSEAVRNLQDFISSEIVRVTGRSHRRLAEELAEQIIRRELGLGA